MIAPSERFNRLMAIVANSSPITEETLRRAFPVDTIVVPNELVMVAAMSRLGMEEVQILRIMKEYRYVKDNLGDEFK